MSDRWSQENIIHFQPPFRPVSIRDTWKDIFKSTERIGKSEPRSTGMEDGFLSSKI